MSNAADWLIAKWERKGLPVIIRMATAYRDKAPVPGYAHKIVVVIELRNPQPSGMPPASEYDDLEKAELAICGQLEAEEVSLCVLAITGCGTRDLIFYTRDMEEAERRIEAAHSLVTSHNFEAAVQPDKEWELYGYFDQIVARPPQKNQPSTQDRRD